MLSRSSFVLFEAVAKPLLALLWDKLISPFSFCYLAIKYIQRTFFFFSEINSLYFKIWTHVLYTKTDTKGDLEFISGLKQNCGFQGSLTRHSDFNETLQLYVSLPMLKIVLQALQKSFFQWPLTRESKKFQRFPGVKKNKEERQK